MNHNQGNGTLAARRNAVAALQRGDFASLAAMVDADPGILYDELQIPGAAEAGPYFAAPKLVWFVANNPRLVDALAPDMSNTVRLLAARGPAREDLTHGLELVASS